MEEPSCKNVLSINEYLFLPRSNVQIRVYIAMRFNSGVSILQPVIFLAVFCCSHIRQSARSGREPPKSGEKAIRVKKKKGKNQNSLKKITSHHTEQVAFRKMLRGLEKGNRDFRSGGKHVLPNSNV